MDFQILAKLHIIHRNLKISRIRIFGYVICPMLKLTQFDQNRQVTVDTRKINKEKVISNFLSEVHIRTLAKI